MGIEISIRIPKYTKWQTKTALPDGTMLISRNLLTDVKIMQLTAKKQYELVCIYLHLLSVVDDKGSVKYPEEILRQVMAQALNMARQNFAYEKRLETLANAGLIEFEIIGEKETKPVLELKNKVVKEKTTKAKKFSDEARNLAIHFIQLLRERNGIVLTRQQILYQFATAESLLKRYDRVTIERALAWAFSLKHVRARITSLKNAEYSINQFVALQANKRDDHKKDGNGRYYMTKEFDPAQDFTIPFEDLDLDCMRRRLKPNKLLDESYKPVLSKIHEPALQVYIKEYAEQGPEYRDEFKEAIQAIGRDLNEI